jgi:hypothetical protein
MLSAPPDPFTFQCAALPTGSPAESALYYMVLSLGGALEYFDISSAGTRHCLRFDDFFGETIGVDILML